MSDHSEQLKILAGGDIHELAVAEIREDIEAAWSRLQQQHPFFFPEEYPCESQLPASLPVSRQSSLRASSRSHPASRKRTTPPSNASGTPSGR